MFETPMLAQLSAAQQSIKDHFTKGGSILTVLIIFAIMGMVVWITYLLTRRQEKPVEAEGKVDHQQLFADLLSKLELSATQRKRLETIVQELEIEYPATILLSVDLFDRCVERWQRGSKGDKLPSPERPGSHSISSIRGVLFPYTKLGFVDSQAKIIP